MMIVLLLWSDDKVAVKTVKNLIKSNKLQFVAHARQKRGVIR